MALQRKFETGEFAIIAEMEPPKGVNVAATVTHAKRVKDRVSAFLVPEMSQAVMRMSALGAAMLLERDGMETPGPFTMSACSSCCASYRPFKAAGTCRASSLTAPRIFSSDRRLMPVPRGGRPRSRWRR